MNSQSDLTARARIRDAAIALFAERGIEATSIREIAQAAGVSSGLLRHHFGSKEGLRDACDEFALNHVTALGMQFIESSLLSRVTPKVMQYQQYLIRSMMDGSPTAMAMFDRALDFGETWLSTSGLEVDDPRAFLAVLAVMKMSMFVMGEQLSHALGQRVDEPAGWMRVLSASVEIFSTPLVPPEVREQAQKVLSGFIAEATDSTATKEQP